MINIKHTFKSHLSQELLGGALGMLVAILAYSLSSGGITKGLLVDSTSPIAASSGAIRVNDKNTNPEILKRLSARASQISRQMEDSHGDITGSTSSISSEAPVASEATAAVTDRSDRSAWIAMRAKQRGLSSTHDLELQHAVAIESVPSVAAPEPHGSASPEEDPTSPDADISPVPADTRLPDSGPVLNLTLLMAFASACVLRRKFLIVAFQTASRL